MAKRLMLTLSSYRLATFVPVYGRQKVHLWQLTWRLAVSIRLSGVAGRVLARLILPHCLDPSKAVLDLALLNTLQLTQELNDRRTGLITATLVLELVVLRAHGDALDGHQCCGGAGCGDLCECGKLLIFDLVWELVSRDQNRIFTCKNLPISPQPSIPSFPRCGRYCRS
jgi:hypothetical protein